MTTVSIQVVRFVCKHLSARSVLRSICAIAGTLGLLFLTAPAQAVVNATVSVDVNDVLGVMPETAAGNNLSVYSNQFGNNGTTDWYTLNPAMPPLINNSGTELIRYPGGSYSDIITFPPIKLRAVMLLQVLTLAIIFACWINPAV